MVERFNYADYELGLMESDYELVKKHQRRYVKYFTGSKKVLDLGCGRGVFLELLTEGGISCVGVDSNPRIIEYAKKKGFDVVLSDIFDYLKNTDKRYDRIFCSHVIEHLPFESVVDLIELTSERMERDGIFVLTFPNPESIRMQLFYFWRDPQHVRYYHSSLVCAILEHYGFRIDYVNDKEKIDDILKPPDFNLAGGTMNNYKNTKKMEKYITSIQMFIQKKNRGWA